VIDRDRLIDRRVAAMFVGVEPATIDAWVKRGRLKRTATGPRGLALYRVGAVLDAERATRRASRRPIRRRPAQL